MLNFRNCSLVTVLLVMSSCAKNDGTGGDQPNGINPELAAEYDRLPTTVLVGVRDDGDTREMRIPPKDVTISDANSALAAFETGADAKVAKLSSELDRASSEPSWAPLQGLLGFGTYVPQVYSAVNVGYTFNYGYTNVYQAGGYSIYSYQKPVCSPPYCSTGIGGGAGGIGGNGGAGGIGGGGYISKYDEILFKAFKKYGVYAVGEKEFYRASKEKYALGERLFNDPILSTSNGVSCASCHVASQGSTIWTSFSPTGYVISGEKKGSVTVQDLLPRNPPALYNLGHSSFRNMFWDSRVAAAPHGVNGYITPAGVETPYGLDNALAAQALFPLASEKEMAGCAAYVNNTNQSRSYTDIWKEIMARVLSKKEYQAMFSAAFPEMNGGGFGIQHLANAIASYESERFLAINSPFDKYLRGDYNALTENQKRGAFYFYGKGGCGPCHSGPFQTDYLHHGVAVVQVGPGEGDGPKKWDDFGYGRVTHNPKDNWKFKTMPLRNITHTGPWGHDGAYGTLFSFVQHYYDPVAAFDKWKPSEIIMPKGFGLMPEVIAPWYDKKMSKGIKAANDAKPNRLGRHEVDAMIDFLTTLTDHKSLGSK